MLPLLEVAMPYIVLKIDHCVLSLSLVGVLVIWLNLNVTTKQYQRKMFDMNTVIHNHVEHST